MRKRKSLIKLLSRLFLLLVVCACVSMVDAQTTYLFRHRKVSLFDGLNNDVNAKVYVSADEQFLLFKSFQGLLVFNFYDRYPLREIKTDLDLLAIGNNTNLCVVRLAKEDKENVVVYNFEKNEVIDTLDTFGDTETLRYDDHYLFDSSDDNILASNKDKLKLFNIKGRKWGVLPLDPKKTAPVNFCGSGYLLFEHVEMIDTNRKSSLCVLNMNNYRVEKITDETKSFVLPEYVATRAGKFIFYDEEGRSNLASIIDSSGKMRVTMQKAPHLIAGINKSGNLLLYQVRNRSGKVRYVPYDAETGIAYDTLSAKIRFFPSGKFGIDPLAVRSTNGFYVTDITRGTKQELFVPYARINKFRLLGTKIIVCGTDSTVKVMDLISGLAVSVPIGFVANELAISRDGIGFTAYQSRGAMAYISDVNGSWHQRIDLQQMDIGKTNFQRLHMLDMLSADRLMVLQRDSIFELNVLPKNHILRTVTIPSDISYGSSMLLDDSLVVLTFKSYSAFDPVKKDSASTDAIALFNFKNQKTISFNSAFDLAKKMPFSEKRQYYIELVGMSDGRYYFEMDDELFSLNTRDGAVTFISTDKHLSDGIYNHIYTPQKIFNTDNTFFDADRKDIAKLEIGPTYREGFRFNKNYIFLDEQNANLNIAQLEAPYKKLTLAFGYKTNEYLVKSQDLKFDGSGSIINNIYYNINDGEKFIGSDDYFVQLFEPYLLQKVLTYYPISYSEKIYLYIPTDLDGITDVRRASIRPEKGITVINVKSKALLDQILSNSTADSIYSESQTGPLTNKIIIKDTSLFYIPGIVSHTLDSRKSDNASAEISKPSAMIAIGVDKYPRTSGLTTLTACVSSAQKLADYFSGRTKFDDTLTLKDAKANRSKILSSIDSLANKIGSSGTLYLYFTGHGVKSEKGAAFYFIPYDGTLKRKKETCLSSFDFAQIVEKTKCRHLVLIIDACYAAEVIPTMQKAADYRARNENFSVTLMLATDKTVSNYQTNTTTDYFSKLTGFLSRIVQGHATARSIQADMQNQPPGRRLVLSTCGKDFDFFDK